VADLEDKQSQLIKIDTKLLMNEFKKISKEIGKPMLNC